VKLSAGVLLFRRSGPALEVLLGHLGGPYFAAKDDGAWGLPKGEALEGEELLATAQREFAEETGLVPQGPFVPLGSVKQKSGKLVHAWAAEGAFDPASLKSNSFELEWPRGSGKVKSFPELDRAAWFTIEGARKKILAAQAPFLDRLVSALGADGDG
jgi:predicted NUDIX family NTP pyrophosphohydrolase